MSEIKYLAADKVDEIKDLEDDVPEIQQPTVPYAHIYNKKLSNFEKIEKIKNYIDELQYNHTG